MNLDERIEALTQTLELFAQMQRDNERQYEKRFREFDTRFDGLLDIVEKLTQANQLN